jgi:hypothetical protein
MKQKTAVDWLVEELFPNNEIFGISNALIYQAKEIEKQQIIDAAKSCNYIGGATDFESEKYYNETFKQQEQ